MLDIQNALFIHFNTDDFFTIERKYLIHNLEIFSSTCNKRIVEYLRIEMAETGTNKPEIHQSTEDIWNLRPLQS